MLDFSFEELARWLPYPADPLTVEDYLGNKNLYPQSLPISQKSLFLDLAILREKFRKELAVGSVRHKLGRLSKSGPVVVPQVIPLEILNLSPNDQLAILAFLDSFEPRGIVSLFTPNNSKLATLLAPETDGLDFKKLPQVLGGVEFDFGLSEKQKMSLTKDGIIKIPTPVDKKIKLEIKCRAGVKILGKDSTEIEVSSGSFGLIIDARGRPLNLPEASAQGRTRLAKWYKELGLPAGRQGTS